MRPGINLVLFCFVFVFVVFVLESAMVDSNEQEMFAEIYLPLIKNIFSKRKQKQKDTLQLIHRSPSGKQMWGCGKRNVSRRSCKYTSYLITCPNTKSSPTTLQFTIVILDFGNIMEWKSLLRQK